MPIPQDVPTKSPLTPARWRLGPALALSVVVALGLSAGCDRVASQLDSEHPAGAQQRPLAEEASGDPAAAASIDDHSGVAAIASLEGRLSAGMAYDDLRSAVLDAGWLPIESTQCVDNVGGEARVCRLLPEVEACSSDGRCAMFFGHPASGARARVDAAGDALRWAETGGDAELLVRSVSFSETETKTETGAADVACPSSAFAPFLAAYAGDPAVRETFTRPLIAVLRHRDIGEDTVSSMVLVPATDYEGFRLHHDGADFHVVSQEGVPDPQPTAVELTQGAAGTERVAYRYGMSEGRTYEFQSERGCWYLASEPATPVS